MGKRMIVDANKLADDSLFRNPTAEYRGIPFWSWNCKVTEELIDWQLDCFVKMGFGGVDIHPRAGLDTEYLGDEYMHLVKYTVEQCKKKGLFCWLYDEDRFPSGAAGGMVTKDFRLRGRFLLLTEKHCDGGILPGYYEDKASFDRAVEEGEKPLGYYAAAYGILFQDGCLKEYRRLYTKEEIHRAWEKGEKVRFAYVKMMEEDPWFEDQAYVDTMNPEAIAQFIRLTHEAYKRAVGEEFGKTVPAIFTDEPRLGKHAQIRKALSGDDVTIPYTDYLAEQMRLKYGIDPLDIAPEYIWELADRRYSENRYRYREMATECFARVFMDQICDWCENHGIAMTGHVLGEETLSSQSTTVGDCMRCYRKMDMPGIDILVDAREFTTAKQASSVARQNGRKWVVSELYGVTHWDCDFVTYKLQGDWQAALGVTVRVPHLSYMSMKGEAKRDWPASIFYQSPWYEEFPYVEDHFARLNTVLTRGRAIVNVAVVHPVESMWICSGPDDQTAGICREMDRDFQNLTDWLLYGNLDFDFLSEALIPEQCGKCDQKGKSLRVGCMEYAAVVAPGLWTIRSTTLDILEAFYDRGGRLIFMGRIPELVDGRKSDRARKLAEKCISIRKDENELLNALQEERIVEIRKENGILSDNLFYQMREDGDCKWLYVCHVNRKNNHISNSEGYEIKIKGNYTAAFYDTLTGDIREIPVGWDNGNTVLRQCMYGEDSILLRLSEYTGDADQNRPKEEKATSCEGNGTVIKLAGPDSFSRTEPNVLLLDYARYQLDDGEIQPREEILRADNWIRGRLGFVLRKGRMNQPWFMQEKETHKVTLYYEIWSEIETEASLAMEDADHSRVTLNGEPAAMSPTGYYVDPDIQTIALPELKKGKNDLRVEIAYNQKSGLENMFLLGDFDVELSGSGAVVREKRNRIDIGDITRQGMPFYTGNLEYTFRFVAGEKDADYAVHVPRFKAPVLAVFLDGKKMGLIAYAPNRLCLGQIAPGEHELTIRLYGNRFNGFGTLHNANDDYRWYGPDSYRTTGDDWTDCYQLRPMGLMAAVELYSQAL